ncbi:hypothetical protein HZA57_09080, partial [Candidatus Poribacteria bacterium]|nr:hypothetical protein [Candidatus Poribacteria bacterium]
MSPAGGGTIGRETDAGQPIDRLAECFPGPGTMQSGEVSEQKIGHLLTQIRWVTRISVALSSAVRVEDVYSVLVAGLISPLGLGYSHALVFEADSHGEVLTGKFALGYEKREDIVALAADLEDETRFLEERHEALSSRAQHDEKALEELQTLQMGTQWVTVFQRLGPENEETRAIGSMSFPVRPGGMDRVPAPNGGTVFQRAFWARRPLVMNKEPGDTRVPKELSALLPDEFAVLPLRTNRGLRSVVLLDRRLTGEPITDDSIEALEWFSTQGALALQNAELIQDLENAYQELKAVDQLKSNFLSIISHELRTPLTAITGFVELILHEKVGPVNESQKSLLTRVAKNTRHLNNMVNDLIEIAEIEAEGVRD